MLVNQASKFPPKTHEPSAREFGLGAWENTSLRQLLGRERCRPALSARTPKIAPYLHSIPTTHAASTRYLVARMGRRIWPDSGTQRAAPANSATRTASNPSPNIHRGLSRRFRAGASGTAPRWTQIRESPHQGTHPRRLLSARPGHHLDSPRTQSLGAIPSSTIRQVLLWPCTRPNYAHLFRTGLDEDIDNGRNASTESSSARWRTAPPDDDGQLYKAP